MSRFVAVRSRRLSLWQSSVHAATEPLAIEQTTRALMRQGAAVHVSHAAAGRSVPASPHIAGAPLTVADHARLSQGYFELAEAQRTGSAAQTETALSIVRDYSEYDLNWANCIKQYNQYYVGSQQAEYTDWSTQPSPSISTFGVLSYTLPNDARVLILGDWGTGMGDAVALLTQAIATLKPTAIIHLGDIYYSGTSAECTANVLNVLSAATAASIPFFTIPGNHEYYSGGGGYYQLIASLNSGLEGCQQQASYFCLRTQDGQWQFLGMDTGINDHNPNMDALGAVHTSLNPLAAGPGLVPSEAQWHLDKLANFGGYTMAKGREVYWVRMAGSFVFKRSKRHGAPVRSSTLELEIDATTGRLLLIGTAPRAELRHRAIPVEVRSMHRRGTRAARGRRPQSA